MIFAHVGFASDGQHEDLAVDYSKTCEQLYTEFAQYLANKYGLVASLECVSHDKPPMRLKDLPRTRVSIP
jgi:hypothetical protein